MPCKRIFRIAALLPAPISIVLRPRCRSDFEHLKANGVDVLVSMLQAEEAASAGLGDESDHCKATGMEFMSVPITDHGIPRSYGLIERAVERLAVHIVNARGVGLHCYAGLGRSPLLAASTLIYFGYSHPDAIELVSQGRGCPVPEMESQHEWLADFAERLSAAGHAAGFARRDFQRAAPVSAKRSK